MVNIEKCGKSILFNSGNKLIVYTEGNFKQISLPEIAVDQQDKQQNENRNISFFCISKDEKYIAISTENKQVVVYDTNFSVRNNFTISRASSLLRFVNENSLIIADKTGDVYLYNLQCEKIEPILLLGHLSVVLDLLVVSSKYVITCDRDEKIRVSNFPNSYNIQCFCLGHEEFVISLSWTNNCLISASGDGTIRFWSFVDGKQLGLINTNEFIDENMISRFCEEINLDEVEVTALPVTKMQLFFCNDKMFIAVSLLKYKKLLLFCVNSLNFTVYYCKHLHIGSCFTFSLSEDLIILTTSEVRFFQLRNGFYVDDFGKNIVLADVNDIQFDNEDNMSLLYKKRFDNVGKYIEKKRARMELK